MSQFLKNISYFMYFIPLCYIDLLFFKRKAESTRISMSFMEFALESVPDHPSIRQDASAP